MIFVTKAGMVVVVAPEEKKVGYGLLLLFSMVEEKVVV